MKKKRYKYIRLNARLCPDCEYPMVSLSRHDYKTCRCGQHYTDGGNDYVRSTVGSIELEWYKRVEA